MITLASITQPDNCGQGSHKLQKSDNLEMLAECLYRTENFTGLAKVSSLTRGVTNAKGYGRKISERRYTARKLLKPFSSVGM